MTNEEPKQMSEQDLSDGELVDQEPLEEVEEPAVRLAGYNQIPDFGDDTKGTLQDGDEDNDEDSES